MDYYEARQFAASIARNAALVVMGLILVVLISVNDGVPPAHIWLAVALFGLVTYSLTSASLLLYYQRPVSVPVVEPEPEKPQVVAEPQPNDRTWQWLKETDLAGLIAYVEQPDAVLSREAVGEWVDQRFYSPREGDGTIPFPQLMCRIRAATTVIANGQTRYAWTPSAPGVLRRLQQRLVAGDVVAKGNLPSPTVDVTNWLNNRPITGRLQK